MPKACPYGASTPPTSETGQPADDCNGQHLPNPVNEMPDGRSASNAAATATGKLLDDIAMRRRDLLRRLSRY